MVAGLVWLITGASTGLGLALTRRILARGDCVVATARDIRRFDPLLSDPDTDRTRIHVLHLDVTAAFSDIHDVITKAVARWGRVDVVVNNAGIARSGPSEELGTENFTQVMNTNFFGTLNVTNALLPHMRARKQGTVVIIGSRTAYRNEFLCSFPAAYAASKAAVHAYGETLSAELKPFNIRVTVVIPGSFDTGLVLPIVGTPLPDYDAAREELRRRMKDRENEKNKGDPEKGMNALMDVIRGEGRASGKDGWPLWLFLGDDAIEGIKVRTGSYTKTLDEWRNVGKGLGRDDEY
ncbi:NAD-P-binding protein [Amylostereum chailletii]|nr:NAD-P-binding protein [Amylostereum chailletii]